MWEPKLEELGFFGKHQETVEGFLQRGAGLILTSNEDNSESLIEILVKLHEEISPNQDLGTFDMRQYAVAPIEIFNQVFNQVLRSASRLVLFPQISTKDRAVAFSRIGELGMLGAATIDAPTCQEAATKFCRLAGYSATTPYLLTRRVQNPNTPNQIRRLAYSAVQLRLTDLLELKTEIEDCNSIFG